MCLKPAGRQNSLCNSNCITGVRQSNSRHPQRTPSSSILHKKHTQQWSRRENEIKKENQTANMSWCWKVPYCTSLTPDANRSFTVEVSSSSSRWNTVDMSIQIFTLYKNARLCTNVQSLPVLPTHQAGTTIRIPLFPSAAGQESRPLQS